MVRKKLKDFRARHPDLPIFVVQAVLLFLVVAVGAFYVYHSLVVAIISSLVVIAIFLVVRSAMQKKGGAD